jgi:hypothetical protein
MRRAGLTVAFATIFAERLQRVPLTGDAGLLARRIGLLSPNTSASPKARSPRRGERTAFAVARGQPVDPGGATHAPGRGPRVFRHEAAPLRVVSRQ